MSLTRIVRMNFAPEKATEFISIFDRSKQRIAAFDGCLHLEMHRDINEPNIFYTISRWRSAEDLENYRRSDLFRETWKATKALFAEPAQAWSLEKQFDSEN